jgi:hypothetical protein
VDYGIVPKNYAETPEYENKLLIELLAYSSRVSGEPG